jgi:hypothetical protein
MTYNPEFIDFIDSEEKLFKYYGFKSKNFNVWNLRSKLYGHPSLVFYVEHYIEKINKNEVDWDSLASNSSLTHILIKNINKIVFYDDDDEHYMVSTRYPKKYSVRSQSICANRNPLVMEIIKNKIKFFGRNGMQVLSANPSAIEILKKNLGKLEIQGLCRNPNAYDILVKDRDLEGTLKYFSYELCQNKNPKIFKLFADNFERFDTKRVWSRIVYNPLAIDIIEKNLDKLDKWAWTALAQMPEAIGIIEKNMDKINFDYLARNPAAKHIIEKNMDKIDFNFLSYNSAALPILEKNINKINWHNFIYYNTNPKKVYLIEQNIKKCLECYLSNDYYDKPLYFSTFFIKYQYEKIKNHFYNTFGKELVEKTKIIN